MPQEVDGVSQVQIMEEADCILLSDWYRHPSFSAPNYLSK